MITSASYVWLVIKSLKLIHSILFRNDQSPSVVVGGALNGFSGFSAGQYFSTDAQITCDGHGCEHCGKGKSKRHSLDKNPQNAAEPKKRGSP